MAASWCPYSSLTYSLVPRPSPSPPHFTLQSPSFLSTQQLPTFPALSFNSTAAFRVPKNPSPLRVLSMRQSRASEVTRQSWNTSILKSETPVLVEFYASWCGPCQMVHRVIDEIATDYDGKLKCFVLNADQDLSVAEEYEIKAVPVVLLFKNGEKCESVVGTMPKEFYVAAIERVLAS